MPDTGCTAADFTILTSKFHFNILKCRIFKAKVVINTNGKSNVSFPGRVAIFPDTQYLDKIRLHVDTCVPVPGNGHFPLGICLVFLLYGLLITACR